MAAQTLKNMGMNVDIQTSDWATIGARRAKRDAPEAGGWSMYVTVAGGFDADSPITNAYLSASCGNGLPGWPCDKQLDELRLAWLKENNPTKRKVLLDAFHTRAFEAVPYVNVGQYSPAFALRKEIKGFEKLWGGLPLVWMLDK
jgi:peptide/nickel transport system substrate-binding protein